MVTPLHDEQLAALSAQVADLRADVRTVKARVESGQIPVHGLASLRERLDALEALAAALQQEKATRTPAPSWIGLGDAEHAARLADLTRWVDGILAVNYPHATPRACWASHPAAVWELSTLQADWCRVYTRKHPPLQDALTWHDRWLPGVTGRVAKILDDCKGECDLAR
jgi:hypothetical protein